ncbi:MAG: hypothetical protein GY704_02100 [Phycisphaeraceae bacterium]|nr:hypothetical protein [Phycisphaeraceae bacterium]
MDRRLVALAVLVVAIVVGALLLTGGGDEPATDEEKSPPTSYLAGTPLGPPPSADEPGPLPPSPEPTPAPVEPAPPEPEPPKDRSPGGAVAANEAKLDSASVTLKLTESTILDALTAIGEKIGLRLYAHPNLDAGILGNTVSFDFQGAPARTVLKFVQMMGLPETKWVVTADGVELQPK